MSSFTPNYGNYFIEDSDGEEMSLDQRLYLWNDNSDRDNLLLVLLVKALEGGSITHDDLRSIGFLRPGQTLFSKP